MEQDGFQIEFKAEVLEKIRKEPGTHLELVRDLPQFELRSESLDKLRKQQHVANTQTDKKNKATDDIHEEQKQGKLKGKQDNKKQKVEYPPFQTDL